MRRSKSVRDLERRFDDQRKKHFTEKVAKEKKLKTYDRKIRNREERKVCRPGKQWECEDTQTDGSRQSVWGWVPPELCEGKRPEEQFPLPIPDDRDLSIEEKYAVVAAIHDRCGKGARINPWPLPPLDIGIDKQIGWQVKVGGTAYHALLSDVPKIKLLEEDDFLSMLEDVEADLAAQESPNGTKLHGNPSESPASKTRVGKKAISPKQGDGNRKWDHAVNWVDNHKKDNPDTTDGKALKEYRRNFRKRPLPTVEKLQKARPYRRRNAVENENKHPKPLQNTS